MGLKNYNWQILNVPLKNVKKCLGSKKYPDKKI
jgi:hypothetical protein